VLFFFGAIDESGDRHVLVGTSMPSIDSMDDLTQGGQPFLFCDWGGEAGDIAKLNVAKMILGRVVSNGALTVALTRQFAGDVISNMTTGKRWMLSEQEIQEWLLKQKKVN
jgi:hypothetical protein